MHEAQSKSPCTDNGCQGDRKESILDSGLNALGIEIGVTQKLVKSMMHCLGGEFKQAEEKTKEQRAVIQDVIAYFHKNLNEANNLLSELNMRAHEQIGNLKLLP